MTAAVQSARLDRVAFKIRVYKTKEENMKNIGLQELPKNYRFNLKRSDEKYGYTKWKLCIEKKRLLFFWKDVSSIIINNQDHFDIDFVDGLIRDSRFIWKHYMEIIQDEARDKLIINKYLGVIR